MALAPGAVKALNTVTFSGGQLFDMPYASDGVSHDGTLDFNITSINPIYYGSLGYFNAAADPAT